MRSTSAAEDGCMVKVRSVLMCHVMLRVVSRTSCPAAKQGQPFGQKLCDVASYTGGWLLKNIKYCRAGRSFLTRRRPHTCRDRIHVVEVALPT